MSEAYEHPKESLSTHEVHIWLAFPDEIKANQALLDRYMPLMNAEEAAQQKRFHFEKDRLTYLVTRAAIRNLLSKYGKLQPHEWQFEKNKYGRPEIKYDWQGKTPLRFNISHTRGLVGIALCHGREIGFDVETLNRDMELVKLANRFFSEREVVDLKALPEHKQSSRFFDYWTFKESYIKARGMGLSIPLDQFTFMLSETSGDVGFALSPEQEDRADRWHFCQWNVLPSFKAALTVEKKTVKPKIIIRKLVPMALEESINLPKIRSSF
jgi:4'-phosphopantetheinyl transferase